ncbi:MAG TPA: hypothetical protein VGB67_07985 [Fibrella sp.]|jgi:hypothetical protein
MQNERQVYVDKVLTNVMLGFPQQDFIAEQVFPTLNVPDLTGLAYKLDESHLRAPSDTTRAALARANRVGMNVTQVSYGPLVEHSLEIPVTDGVMRNYDAPLVPETNATNVVTGQLLIDKEILVRNAVTDVNNYAAANKITLTGANQWSDPTSPLETRVNTAREAVKMGCGSYPNQVVMNKLVRDTLRQHNEVKNRLVGAVAVTNEQRDTILRDIFQVERIIIGDAVSSDQAENSTADGTKSRIWGDDVVMQYVTPAPAIETLTQGYLLRLNPKNATGNGSPLVGVDKWYEKEIKSTIIRATDFYVPWVFSQTAGYVFKDVLV